MNIAIINLCHEDPGIVARSAEKLTRHECFDVYVHVDLKSGIGPFVTALSGIPRVHFSEDRFKVYWGGFNAVRATVETLRQALKSPRDYRYFALLQNYDYPIRSNEHIISYFEQNNGSEFIRGCPIARTKDWHYSMKYKIYNRRDDNFYLARHSKRRMYLRYAHMLAMSCATIFSNGVLRDRDGRYELYYGAAQWAITRDLAEYFIGFYDSHPGFNSKMAHIQFPDEEYFHTVVHNSPFKYRCQKYDEPARRWLVNWRNLHYFEHPGVITVFTEKDYDKIMAEDALFVRKVRTGVSDGLLDRIDSATGGNAAEAEAEDRSV